MIIIAFLFTVLQMGETLQDFHFIPNPESRRLAYLLRHFEFVVTAAYLSTLRSNKLEFLAYEVFYLAIPK